MKHKLTALVLALVACLTAPAALATDLITTTVIRMNAAPVAENLSFETYMEVALTEALRAVDPEGDCLTFSVTREPKKGTVTVEGDQFTYTPAAGKKGKDTFTYVAVDELGSVSQEATVTVTIRRQKTAVTYADMQGHPAAYAALRLAEEGIFTGAQVGGVSLFEPDKPVTRGEFLAMCLTAARERATVEVGRTGFADDGEIPAWQKPYVAAAVLENIVAGSRTGSGATVFRPNDPVTFREAGVMLNNALGITDVAVSADSAVPVWAQQADANLASLRATSSPLSAEVVTRAEAAKLLLTALSQKTEKRTGLLAWAQ
ncbi:MAG: Ig-like domain-containing protein [bacterium]